MSSRAYLELKQHLKVLLLSLAGTVGNAHDDVDAGGLNGSKSIPPREVLNLDLVLDSLQSIKTLRMDQPDRQVAAVLNELCSTKSPAFQDFVRQRSGQYSCKLPVVQVGMHSWATVIGRYGNG